MAKARFERGMAHYHLDEFKAAIEQWEEGFRLKPDPSFLYNIGQAYRLSGQPDKAVSFYKKYLKLSPKAPNRAEVERHIAALQKEIDARPSATAPAPARSMSPAETAPTGGGRYAEPRAPEPAASNFPPPGTTTPPLAAAPTPQTSTIPAGADLSTTASTPASTPVYHKAWFWTAVGVTVVAAAVVTYVLVSRDSGSDVHQLPRVVFQ